MYRPASSTIRTKPRIDRRCESAMIGRGHRLQPLRPPIQLYTQREASHESVSIKRRVAQLGVLIATVPLTPLGIGNLNGTPNASSACSGVNSGYQITNWNGGTETYNSGTCDNLHDYRGNLLDAVNGDGCIWVAFNTSPGFPPLAAGNYGTSPQQCSTITWKLYSYTDADSIGWTRMCRAAVGCDATYWQHVGY